MENISKGTMISLGAVAAFIVPITMAWAKLEARVDAGEARGKARQIQMDRMETRIYELQLFMGMKQVPKPVQIQMEE